MSTEHIHNIRALIQDSGFNDKCEILPLPSSGSTRNYYRVIFTGAHHPKTLIASFNNDIRENIAHNSFTTHFRSLKLNVPEIIARDSSYQYFLMQDLGDITLFDMLNTDPDMAIEYYKKVVSDLVKFQVNGIRGLDLDVAYPVKKFNKRSILWDLNYFKYYFVKPHNINFDENLLEDDFEKFADSLLSTELEYFVYRDFQSRNIMIHNNEPWYIDFQGGRKGPLQYDLISLLFQVKANLSDEIRDILFNHYQETLQIALPGKQVMFDLHYNDFIYFRLMQVMGAYGFRGLVQRKAHFLQSIPLAISLLTKLLQNSPMGKNLREFTSILNQISALDYKTISGNSSKLTISINSFSFKKKGIPTDISGNGGGHVFDCRSLPNPGRIADLRDYTGLQQPVIDYLAGQKEVDEFLNNAIKIVEQSIYNYQKRSFNNLQVNFGCTGGMHRSVYSASAISQHVRNKFPELNIEVNHFELTDN